MSDLAGQEDAQLTGIINQNSLTSLPTLASEDGAIVKLGETLFSEVNLSGHRNTSCLSLLNDPVSIWDSTLSDRLLNQNQYAELFNKACPDTATENLNPGHIGRAQ